MIEYKSLDFLGFPDYKISNNGNVLSYKHNKCKQIKPQTSSYNKKNKCLQVTLCNNGYKKIYKIHNLVLLAFVGPSPNNMMCRHLNGDFYNNKLTNLCWGSSKENQQDRIKHHTDSRGIKSVNAKLTEEQIYKIRELYNDKQYTTLKLSNIFNVSRRHINRIINYQRWSHII